MLVKVSERYVDASHSRHLVRITDLPTKFSLTKLGNNVVSPKKIEIELKLSDMYTGIYYYKLKSAPSH